jgi:hypothetical protein
MDSPYAAPDMAILDTADRIGRTAYLWLRQHAASHDACHSPASFPGKDRRAHLRAAGFISMLCDSLQLTTQHGLLAAYVYALLDDSDSNSLVIATILFEAHTVPRPDLVFEEGRSMAGEMLNLLDDSGYQQVSEDDTDWRITHFAC